ncbi:TPA: SAM-dependent methyltransferase [Legionella pneumophila]
MHKLIIVGSGIKSVSHITEETKKIIQKADKVLYLVNEDILKLWIEREANLAESLEPIYFATERRTDSYHAITKYIIEQYTKVQILCVVFYGHPTVFAYSALKAAQFIRQKKGNAVILPAISSMDCLYSDLQIDPGKNGCFSIEATELLIYERQIDINAHLIIWQAANLGTHNTNKTKKIDILCKYLQIFYKADHPVCIYEAAQLPTQSPRIEWIKLNQLENASITTLSTLYFPPIPKKSVSKKYLSLLEMEIENFSL